MSSLLFFFNHTATTEIYTLSLHDALPICRHRGAHLLRGSARASGGLARAAACPLRPRPPNGRRAPESLIPRRGPQDRKSTRLNSSHPSISYAVFCLKKKTTPY